MLRHLNPDSITNILFLFNRVWKEHYYPSSWREAIVIPILKPGKVATDPLSYRPIALTSCFCKTLERMVNTRLVYVLEKEKLISSLQSGFRKDRSTVDNLVFLESQIRDAFHVLYLRKKCERSLNILKVLSNTLCGSDRILFFRVYQALILSRLDYGCVVYGSARASVLRRLDTIHHSALGIISGAFRTSPITSLYVVCHQPPLELRRRQLSTNYFIRAMSVPSHPLKPFSLATGLTRLYDARSFNFNPFSERANAILNDAHLSNTDIQENNILAFPHWDIQIFNYNNPFSGYDKAGTADFIYQQLFSFHRSKYSKYIPVYMDGSKTAGHVGYASVGHASTDCGLEQKCVNCSQHHSYDSKLCPKWKTEKEIQTLKTNKNISYLESRKLVTPQLSQTYAQVTKPSIATNTTQTDENITKIKCPPLELLKPLSSVPQPNASPSIPSVSTSSYTTQANILTSATSIKPTTQIESRLPGSISTSAAAPDNSLNTSSTETCPAPTTSNKFAASSEPLSESATTSNSELSNTT
ncbi:RNase H domain-containing protein [Trichonephila clavipes]|nr:RNase H domain-containing protein [Trichonephila clavipes]